MRKIFFLKFFWNFFEILKFWNFRFSWKKGKIFFFWNLAYWPGAFVITQCAIYNVQYSSFVFIYVHSCSCMFVWIKSVMRCGTVIYNAHRTRVRVRVLYTVQMEQQAICLSTWSNLVNIVQKGTLVYKNANLKKIIAREKKFSGQKKNIRSQKKYQGSQKKSKYPTKLNNGIEKGKIS